MCGIAGIWSDLRIDRDEIRRFTRSMTSRGPDGEGYQFEDYGRLSLGHRRLAILDPSDAGKQPMSYLGERFWITFNGEIFNFLELRNDLVASGYQFESDSDTEVILAAYDRWGADCLSRFNGMWAFAIWDREEQKLFAARDRFGIKPFYFVKQSRFFAFASEIKAFFFLEKFAARVQQQLQRNFDFNSDSTESTNLEDVVCLKPGHALELRGPDRRPTLTRWWHPHRSLISVSNRYADQVDEFRALFDDACRLRLRSDVPVASAISGGIDSTAVHCTLSILSKESITRRPQEWRRVYFADAPDSAHSAADRPYAELAVESTGSELSRLNLWSEPIEDDIENYLIQTEGTGSLGNYWSWALYRRIRREGIAVTLDGQGADELLCGYPHMLINGILHPAAELNPARVFAALRILVGMRSPMLGRQFAPSRVFAAWMLKANPLTRRWGPSKKLTSGYPDEYAWKSHVSPEESSVFARLSPLRKIIYQSVCYRDLPPVLRFFDLISMSHGVEIRMPFLDWRLVQFILSVKHQSYASNGYTKRILRDAMKDRIPEKVRTRRDKVGFARPVSDILRGPLKNWALDQVNQSSFIKSPFFDGQELSRSLMSPNETNDRAVWRAIQQHWIRESWASKTKASSILRDVSALAD